ncbi:sodium-dependent bicarbonate transport family permease [filamentous cyanobacterium LEGE 11480]|uniref:Sodium-dependent bicarbonate transport family permease n=1 Tax=Romeriopsis navalis LEGE 11480 TaxID=2777977 RepID=A0A928VK01_9CYAN|nr:sodium-dependent bicarbonate transport family permease [Romeriopsis navalis]MBE9029745.1 sodium-dependent bicarbonate transport family permease [Romeriopsis navalis LEGE 11480]
MNLDLIVSNILNPPILFFFLGMFAVWVKSDLEIPAPIPKLFSLYLLLAIGFKGGVELSRSGITQDVLLTMLAAIVMASIVPVYSFFLLRWKLDPYNAAAIAATYGSISAVTFITAGSFLGQLNIDYDGYMVAALALMESPAIIVGLVLVNVFGSGGGNRDEEKKTEWGEVLREAFLNGSVLLLVGSVIIGLLTGENGWTKLKPFTQDMFYGALTFFLLDMGLVAAKQIKDLKKTGVFLIAFALLMPLGNAALSLPIAYVIQMSQGDALLFAVLCASASYIAVPAAMRMTVPEANPSLYISTALAVTFPFNIIVGIPLYLSAINLFWS